MMNQEKINLEIVKFKRWSEAREFQVQVRDLQVLQGQLRDGQAREC